MPVKVYEFDVKTMTAKELGEMLIAQGDKMVLLSSDAEGNSYGTIMPKSIKVHPDGVVLYPWNEYLDI